MSTMGNSTLKPHHHLDRTQTFEYQLIILINVHILLAQILFGVTGNFMNLIVLLNKTMRSRTNLLPQIFAAMAFADLFLLLFQLHQVLFILGFIRNSLWYRNHARHLFVAASNWLSAVSIWCMTYATIERVQVFRSPFRTSKRNVSLRFILSLSMIVIFAFLLTFINWFPAEVRQEFFLMPYISLANTLLVVFIPLIICATLNILLIVALRRNTMPMAMLNDCTAQKSLIIARNKTERKDK
ncbi:hypothetical protein WR25_00213 [Diploscapter pachys]|uniref:G-protein coupled receptors family 1 profile domain-containing protein n=1 Tax=Diploscapter pachys TaxID=2018661 RepID=A0A2A2J4C0_9BILA|nr:hypothetical protein WR25_00213 [Diploscapter pachys]